MEGCMAIVLAAGEGKRMKSQQPKVLHKICGKSMIDWVLEETKKAGIERIIIVAGSRAEEVIEHTGKQFEYVIQHEQLGTGHAVMQAKDIISRFNGYIIVLAGDTPLITAQTLKQLVNETKEMKYDAALLTARIENPFGYGRIIYDKKGIIEAIVEEKDASPEQKNIHDINSGIYCFKATVLCDALKSLKNDNNQNEFYLTDTISIIRERGLKTGGVKIFDAAEINGINDRIQLYEANETMKKRIMVRLMREGVTIIDPSSVFIENDVEIGMDTVIYPGTIIEGPSKIGSKCVIGPYSRIISSVISDEVEINNSVVKESVIDSGTRVGPFAYIRPESRIGSNVKIGDFVEIKKSSIGKGTSISHLAYVGDAEIGCNVNIGCGVVFVNYNGREKLKTIVGDEVFIGCNTNLVSPVEVKSGAYIAAGSTITEDVPENALAIARSRQTNKEDWALHKGLYKKKGV